MKLFSCTCVNKRQHKQNRYPTITYHPGMLVMQKNKTKTKKLKVYFVSDISILKVNGPTPNLAKQVLFYEL